MTVYVDDMYKMELGVYLRMKMSHMIADTHEELLAMVDKIGVQRKWIQHEGTAREHFDISLLKRKMAVEVGAVEVTMKQLAMMCANRRKTGQLGQPDPAYEDN